MEDGSSQALEDIINRSGQFGFYQKRTYFVSSCLQAMAVSVLVYATVVSPDPCPEVNPGDWDSLNDTFPHVNQTAQESNLTKKGSCTETSLFVIALKVPESLAGLDARTLSIYAIYGQVCGVALGCLLGGFVTDVFGRRKSMFCYFFIMLAFHSLTGVSLSWPVYVFCRTGVGLTAGAFLVVSVVMPLECLGQQWRDVCICSGFWTLGVVVISLETLITENWRYLAFVSGALAAPFIGAFYLVPESPRWLLCQQRFKAAEAGIKEMISCNQNPVVGVTALLDRARASVVAHMHQKNLVASTVYFCLADRIDRITGNVYVDRFLPYIVDLPLSWSAVVVNKCLGRRWCLFLYAVASGFASLSVIILDMTGNLQSMPNMMKGLAIFGKLGVTASLTLIAISAVEMYPTVIRCMGTAIALFSIATGAIVSKQLKFLDDNHYTVPFLVYGGMMITVGFIGLFLPETYGRALPNILACRHRKIPIQEGKRLVNTWDSL